MELHKKILLGLTILITSIILYRLWCSRKDISSSIKPTPQIESYTNINIQTCGNYDLPLSQYFIKGSWNSAYVGHSSFKYNTNTMDASMVMDVLDRGCRFLDFEIYAVKIKPKDTDYTPVVGFSYSSGNGYMMNSSDPPVPFDDVLKKIALFTTDDPIFIQIRIKSAKPDMVQKVVTSIRNIIGVQNIWNANGSSIRQSQIYSQPLNTFMKKKIFIADFVNSDPEFKTLTDPFYLSTNPLLDINIPCMSYTDTLKAPIKAISLSTSDNKNGTVINSNGSSLSLKEAFPPFDYLNISNPFSYQLRDFITNHGINILPYRFYIDDTNLEEYEKLFSKTTNCPFIPMSSLLVYYSGIPVSN